MLLDSDGNWLLLLLLLSLIVVRICEGKTVELLVVLRLGVGVKLMEDDDDDLTVVVVVLLPPPLILLLLFVDESIDVILCCCCSEVVDVVDLTVLPRLQGAAETAVDLVALLSDTSMLAVVDLVVGAALVSVAFAVVSPLLNWKTDVDRTAWPESSPERTKLPPPPPPPEVVAVVVCCCCVILLVVVVVVLLERSPPPPVGSVTLDVCIMGDGSTSIDSLRGIDDAEEPVPPTLTSWTLLY